MKIKIFSFTIALFIALHTIAGLSNADEMTDPWIADFGETHELEKLRAENPEEFQEHLNECRANIRQRLEELRGEDPEKFQRIIFQRKRRVLEYVEQLNSHSSQSAQLLFERRRLNEKVMLQKAREQHPEKFQRIIENRYDELNRDLEKIKESDPERYEKILSLRQNDIPRGPPDIHIKHEDIYTRNTELELPPLMPNVGSPGVNPPLAPAQIPVIPKSQPITMMPQLLPAESAPILEKEEIRSIQKMSPGE